MKPFESIFAFGYACGSSECPDKPSLSPDPSREATLVLSCLNKLDDIYQNTTTGPDLEAKIMRKEVDHNRMSDKARLKFIFNRATVGYDTTGNEGYRELADMTKDYK